MRKIRLDPDEVRVSTFDTAGLAERARGTVEGRMTFPNTDFQGCTQGTHCSSPHTCRADEK